MRFSQRLMLDEYITKKCSKIVRKSGIQHTNSSGKEKVDGWRAKLFSGTGPNTGISKFNLDIDAHCDIISATCLSFLSDDHLNKCIA